MGDSRIKDVSALLSSFFDKDKLRQGERYSGFFASWPSLVGDRLAAHSRVVDIDKGLLIIEAEHPGWIQLLQIRQSSILADVARQYPELALRGIVFRLSGQGGATAAKAQPPEAVVLEDEAEDGAEAGKNAREEDTTPKPTAEDIKDPEFQALFSSLKKAMRGKG
jgi:hypothetical protein